MNGARQQMARHGKPGSQRRSDGTRRPARA